MNLNSNIKERINQLPVEKRELIMQLLKKQNNKREIQNEEDKITLCHREKGCINYFPTRVVVYKPVRPEQFFI